MSRKLTDNQVREVYERYINGELQRDLCKELSVSQKTLRNNYNRLNLPSRKWNGRICHSLFDMLWVPEPDAKLAQKT